MTTEIYTLVNIQKLIEGHRLSHLAKLPQGEMGPSAKTLRTTPAARKVTA
jgi:hypothetical protein